MENLSCPYLGSHSSLPHHYVALCLTLPIFTWLFFVHTYGIGHLLHPDLGSHLSFPHYFVVLCLPLPHQASFALQSTSLYELFLLLIDQLSFSVVALATLVALSNSSFEVHFLLFVTCCSLLSHY